MTEFWHDPNADVNATHKIGNIWLAPSRLVKRFGPPQQDDGYKSSGMYSFVDNLGHVYTLYDWKATSLFEEGAPTPEQFWGNDDPCELQIGGREDSLVEDFKLWLANDVVT